MNIKSVPIYISGIIESPQGLKDGTMKFTVRCNELSPDKVGQLFILNQRFAYVALKEEAFKNEEKELLEGLQNNEVIGKTPSQRLRSVLFLCWKNNNEGFQSYEQYYNSKMEQILNHFKSKIDEIGS
jgi:hypothetical protein